MLQHHYCRARLIDSGGVKLFMAPPDSISGVASCEEFFIEVFFSFCYNYHSKRGYPESGFVAFWLNSQGLGALLSACRGRIRFGRRGWGFCISRLRGHDVESAGGFRSVYEDIRVRRDIKSATTSPLADTLFASGDVFVLLRKCSFVDIMLARC